MAPLMFNFTKLLQRLAPVMSIVTHRRSQGVQWVHLHPQGGEENLGVIYRGNFVSAPPAHQVHTPRQSKMQFLGHFLLGGGYLEVYLVVLDRPLRATTRKKVVTFFEVKSAPRTKSWLRLCCKCLE